MHTLRCLSIVLPCIVAASQLSFAQQKSAPPALAARVVAVGITGAGAVAPVGTFHPGGPIQTISHPPPTPNRAASLTPNASWSPAARNSALPRAHRTKPKAPVLSLDPDGPTFLVPSVFGDAGARPAHWRPRPVVRGANPAFLNSVTTPGAASPPSRVSNPLGISLNNAFGRGVVCQRALRLAGHRPADDRRSGRRALRQRTQQTSPAASLPATSPTGRADRARHVAGPAVANALVGFSPDGSKRAVFVVLTADGALAQAHAEPRLDGLAPAAAKARSG